MVYNNEIQKKWYKVVEMGTYKRIVVFQVGDNSLLRELSQRINSELRGSLVRTRSNGLLQNPLFLKTRSKVLKKLEQTPVYINKKYGE